ncbi:hypothetical protein ACUR5C_07960 [Aliikangiella sp. IMCC44653]
MNKHTAIAFLFSAITASVTYVLYFTIEYYFRVGTPLSSPIGFLVLVLAFVLTFVAIIAVPMHLALVGLNWDKPVVYLLLGGLLGGIPIALNPVGILIGFIAALVFNFVRARENLNKSLKKDANNGAS